MQYVDCNDNSLRLLGFADDLNIIGNSLADVTNASRALEKAQARQSYWN